MIKKLIATTALVGLMSSAAIAMDNDGKATNPELSFSIFSKTISPDATVSSNGYLSAQGGQVLASGLIGQTVYAYEVGVADHESIGQINDIVMSPEGDAQAAIVGVGGFIGLGEKDVAVDFAQLQWMNWEGERHLVLAASKDDLEQAPQFNREDLALVHNADLLIVDSNNLSADKMIGTSVYGETKNEIGKIGDVILGADEQVTAYIVDVGGFLGLGAKPVAMDASELTVYRDAQGELHIFTPYSEEQLSALPEYEESASTVISFLR